MRLILSVLILVLYGYNSGYSFSLLPGGGNQAATVPSGWWNAAYQYRRPISVTGTAGQVAMISLETINLINSGKLRPDRKDLRVVYNGAEIDYQLVTSSTLRFKLQGSGTGRYSLYYGNSTENTMPPENWHNVLPWYADGTDAASFSGSVGTTTVPVIRFLKTGSGPLITSGHHPQWYGVRDFAGLFYENGWWYTQYDSNPNMGMSSQVPGLPATGWRARMAKSQDRLTWTEVDPQIPLQPVSSFDGNPQAYSSASGYWKSGSTYYFASMQGSSVEGGGAGAPYIDTYLFSSTSPTGPFSTLIGHKFSYDAAHPGANNNTIAPYSADGGTTIPYIFYSYGGVVDTARCDGWCRGATYATPGNSLDINSSVWTPTFTQVIPETEQIEAPAVLKDSNGYYWMLAEQIGKMGPYEHISTGVMYWSNAGPLTWNAANKTTIVVGDYGNWDAVQSNINVDIPVIKDGMIYFMYDATNDWNFIGNGHHANMIESRWPLSFGSGLTTTYNSPVTSTATFSEQSVKVRVRFTGTNAARLGIGSPTGNRAFITLDSGTYPVAAKLYTENAAATTDSTFTRIKGNVATFVFNISAAGYQTIYQGTLIDSGTTNLNGSSLYLNGDAVIENIQVIPLNIIHASVGAEETSNSIISGTVHDAATDTILGNAEVTINGTQTVIADSDGSYSATVLPGTYTVTASKSGYELQGASVTTTSSQTSTQDFNLKPLIQVKVTLTGAGAGIVSDAAAEFFCGSMCQKLIVWNTPLNLIAASLPYSLFNGWSGAGCSGTANCALTVLTPTTITADFNLDEEHFVRADGPPHVYYSSLQDAFNAVTGGVVRVWGVTFTENLLLNRPVTIRLLGGLNAGYTAQTGETALQGTLTIDDGCLMVDRVTIR